MAFNVCAAYERILEDEKVASDCKTDNVFSSSIKISTPLASVLALVELIENSQGGVATPLMLHRP